MRERMYIGTMQDVLSNTSKIMVSGGEGNNNLLYLPLDKLMERSGSGSSGNTGIPANSTPGVNPGLSTDSSNRIPTQLQQRDPRSRETR